MPRKTQHESAEQDCQQLAEMIASGEVRFPKNLAPAETLRLARAVRELHRRQLMEWLALEVARSILEVADR